MPHIIPYLDKKPTLHPSAVLMPTAVVAGDVTVGAESSLWFHVTVRGDVNFVRIGARTNIQDNACLHVTRVTHPLLIGDTVTVGHAVTLHGCTLEDGCFVGMHACIMDGAVVETGGMVAAGALVPPNKRVRAGELWAGTPATFKRPMTDAEKEFIAVSADNYVRLAKEYK